MSSRTRFLSSGVQGYGRFCVARNNTSDSDRLCTRPEFRFTLGVYLFSLKMSEKKILTSYRKYCFRFDVRLNSGRGHFVLVVSDNRLNRVFQFGGFLKVSNVGSTFLLRTIVMQRHLSTVR